MFQEALYEQILELPDAPLLIQKVTDALQEERKRREQFYNDIDESMKAEFINGEVIVHSPVMKRHKDALGLLYKLIDTFVQLGDLGEVGFEKIMSKFSRNDYEPDLVFFTNEKAKYFVPEQTLFPVPDFVVEVLSKGTMQNDRGVKFDDYETHGVAEYWIIDPTHKVIEQYLLENRKYELYLKASEGNIRSRVIRDFEVPIQAIFDKRLNMRALREMLD